MQNQRIVLTITGAYDVAGGIAGHNKNIIRSLLRLTADKAMELIILSFHESNEAQPAFLPSSVTFHGFNGDKRAFVTRMLRTAIGRGIFVFDHVTLALPVLPLIPSRLIKTIIFAHGSEAWRWIRRTSRWSFQAASLCLTNSEYTLRKMEQRFSGFNGRACPLGLSPEFPLNSEIPTPLDKPLYYQAADGQTRKLGNRVLLLVGRMHPDERAKGHYPLLRVLPGLLQQYDDLQLVFAGPGDDRPNLIHLARQLGVAHAVFLPGYLPVAELQKLYRHCYAYTMPSKQEGFGLAYLEAMNYGKPCIGRFDDGAEEVISHMETGLLVHDPKDTVELSAVLRSLLDDSRWAQQLGRAGFGRLHSNFTADHVQERIKNHIRSVL